MIWKLFSLALAAAACSALLAVVVLYRRCRRLQRGIARTRARRRSLFERLRVMHVEGAEAVNKYWSNVRDTPAALLVTTPGGNIVAASRPLLEMLDYPTEEELRRQQASGIYADALERQARFTAEIETRGVLSNCEFRLRRRDGTEVHVLTSARLIRQPDGSIFHEGVFTDITKLREAEAQRRELQAQLNLSRKLEVIGQLASGIAHEINTPIQFIGDNTYFLHRAFDRLLALLEQYRRAAKAPLATRAEADLATLVQDVKEALQGSFEGVERVAETVRAMKEFAHPGDSEKTATDLNHAIQTTLIVARNEYKHAADIVLELGEIPPVDCRRGEINKVLLNLIVNAAHAIESLSSRRGRGIITIHTGSTATHVDISISDNGCGIPQAVIARIFDPFFTTKPVGKGTGQGLAIARAIIVSHGGELTVTSTVGVGTTFNVRLPLAFDDEQRVRAQAGAELETAIG